MRLISDEELYVLLYDAFEAGIDYNAPYGPAGMLFEEWYLENHGLKRPDNELFFVDVDTEQRCPSNYPMLCTITRKDHLHKDGRER